MDHGGQYEVSGLDWIDCEKIRQSDEVRDSIAEYIQKEEMS